MLIYQGPNCLEGNFQEAYINIGSELFNRLDHKVYVGGIRQIRNDGILTTPHPNEGVWEKVDEYYTELIDILSSKKPLISTGREPKKNQQVPLDKLKSLSVNEFDFPTSITSVYITVLDMMNFAMMPAIEYSLSKLPKKAFTKEMFSAEVFKFTRSYATSAVKHDLGDGVFFTDYREAYIKDGVKYDKSKEGNFHKFNQRFNRFELDEIEKEKYAGYINMLKIKDSIGISDLLAIAVTGSDANFFRLWNLRFSEVMSEEHLSIHQFKTLSQSPDITHDIAKKFILKAKEKGNREFLSDIKTLIDEAYKENKHYLELI